MAEMRLLTVFAEEGNEAMRQKVEDCFQQKLIGYSNDRQRIDELKAEVEMHEFCESCLVNIANLFENERDEWQTKYRTMRSNAYWLGFGFLAMFVLFAVLVWVASSPSHFVLRSF